MKNDERIQLGVKFINYTAFIVARKKDREVVYGEICFLSGMTTIKATGGWVTVPKRADLVPFVASLPLYADRLRNLSRSKASDEDVYCTLELALLNSITVSRSADISQFIKQIGKRHLQLEHMLEEVETVGAKIDRRPFREDFEEGNRTGTRLVTLYGRGLFVDGHLLFYPEHRGVLVEEIGRGRFSVTELEGSNKSATPMP